MDRRERGKGRPKRERINVSIVDQQTCTPFPRKLFITSVLSSDTYSLLAIMRENFFVNKNYILITVKRYMI